jgi:hypothetical protein
LAQPQINLLTLKYSSLDIKAAKLRLFSEFFLIQVKDELFYYETLEKNRTSM